MVTFVKYEVAFLVPRHFFLESMSGYIPVKALSWVFLGQDLGLNPGGTCGQHGKLPDGPVTRATPGESYSIGSC